MLGFNTLAFQVFQIFHVLHRTIYESFNFAVVEIQLSLNHPQEWVSYVFRRSMRHLCENRGFPALDVKVINFVLRASLGLKTFLPKRRPIITRFESFQCSQLAD